MTVSHILENKGDAVFTCAPHRTLSEIADLLAHKGIGAVVIVGGDGEVLGMLSERDIIKALARHGAMVLDDAASKHMTAKVVTANPQTSVHDAMSAMTNGRFRHLPVVQDDRLVGLVSIGDVVKHRLQDIEAEKQSMLDYIGTA